MGEDAVSRRGFLGLSVAAAATTGAALASPGRAYGVIDKLVRPPERLSSGPRVASATALPAEQYLFFETATVTDNGVVVSVPPLYHEVVTASLEVEQTLPALKAAQRKLEAALRELEASGLLDFKPSGLGLSVSWGLPYLTAPLIARAWARHGPIDLRASEILGAPTSVLLDSVRFTTDPATSLLERNDVCITMASDTRANLSTAYDHLFSGTVGEIFKVTTRRMGFVDASRLASSHQSLTKRFALANKLPAAHLIPDQAELFLGFTSTQQAALGPSLIANFESLGFTNQTKTSYFANGTTLALSHIYEDLAAWYGRKYDRRVAALFSPRIANAAVTPTGTLTIPQSAPGNTETEADVIADAARFHTVGHSSSMQPVSRLASTVTDPHGNVYPAGTAIPVRADFNTVDHPFAYTSDPKLDGYGPGPAAGLHFLMFVPSSFLFQQIREAMDGEYTGQPGLGAAAQRSAFMEILQTTHRQNFLTPPRVHRSFPLVELLD
ncbi:MAG: hypothetical protein ACLPQS_06605 [Acidimicrobiales bacterium]